MGIMYKYQSTRLLVREELASFRLWATVRDGTAMNRFPTIAMVLMLIASLFLVSLEGTEAATSLPPLTPHEVRVLVVSPANLYFKGGHYLISDLAGYGFNVTQHTSDSAETVDYRSDSKTANLDQYDVVILHGSYRGIPPTEATLEEIRHFVNFGGVLISIGNSFFVNETSGTWWSDLFFSVPLQMIEQRFGVVITRFLKDAGALEYHSNGVFTLVDNTVPGLPASLDYVRGTYGASQFQMDLETTEASPIYRFSTQGGKTTDGITFFRNSTGAVGIYIQGAYIYAEQPSTNKINYLGITDHSKRSPLLASLIAYALNRDVDTIVKPQPLANIRLDGVGQYHSGIYLNASLAYFNSVLDRFNMTPTIGFIDYLDFRRTYWQTDAPMVLSQLKGAYRDWEYSTSLRYYTDPRPMTQGQLEALIDNIRGNYSKLGMDLFSTVIAPTKGWNQSTLDAMSSRDLYLLDILDSPYNDWWTLRINSSVIVHSGLQMLLEKVVVNGSLALAEDFAQPGLDKDSIHYKYFSRRDKLVLALLNGFPSFVYYVPNFRWDKVGTYSLETVFRNLTSEVPDVRFVPLIEAGLYFGNQWAHVKNAVKEGNVVEFDVDASSVPSIVNIGKGMLWLKVSANESIQEVTVGNDRWFYYDEHSIRILTPETSIHVRVVLGTSPSPRVDDSRYRIIKASFDGNRFNVSIVSTPNLNVSVRLLLPKVGIFSKDNWSVFCLEETNWNFNFSSQNRMLEVWGISDGMFSFEVGVFWIIDQTTPSYDSDVTISANYSGLELEINQVILSYNLGSDWVNASMTLQDELWLATIPVMPYGSTVRYRLFAHATVGKWLVTQVINYEVVDETPPDVDDLEWGPSNPAEGQPVSVRVSVSEPENASGVKDVVLNYYVGTQVTDIARTQRINMTNNGGIWTADVPGQGSGAPVTFWVTATDYAEPPNSAMTNNIRYNVSLISLWLIILIIGVVLGVGAGAGLYYFKVRKPKQEAETTKPQEAS